MEGNNPAQEVKPEQVIQEPSAEQPLNKKGYFLPILIVIVVLVIITTGGYFLNQKQAKPATIPQQISQPTPSPTSSDETANWKTYTNTDYGYELRYPSTWKVEIPSNTSGVGKPSVYISLVSDTQFKFDSECCFPYSVGINVYENSKNKSIKDLGGEGSSNFTYTEDSLNGMKAFRTSNLPSQFGSETIFLKPDNKDYISFTISPFSKNKPFPNQESQYKTFNMILSTFKFLDQNTIDISGWKTYKNVEIGFQINYPNEWEYSEAKAGGDPLHLYLYPKHTNVRSRDQNEALAPIILLVLNDSNPLACPEDNKTCLELKVDGVSAKKYALERYHEVVAYKNKNDDLFFELMTPKLDKDSFAVGSYKEYYSFYNLSETERKNIFDKILSTFKFTQ